MKTIYSIILIILMLVGCTKPDKDFTIEGKITDIRTTTWCSGWIIVINYNTKLVSFQDNAELLKLRYKNVSIQCTASKKCFMYNEAIKIDTTWKYPKQ